MTNDIIGHYTGVEAGLSILDNKKFWFTRVSVKKEEQKNQDDKLENQFFINNHSKAIDKLYSGKGEMIKGKWISLVETLHFACFSKGEFSIKSAQYFTSNKNQKNKKQEWIYFEFNMDNFLGDVTEFFGYNEKNGNQIAQIFKGNVSYFAPNELLEETNLCDIFRKILKNFYDTDYEQEFLNNLLNDTSEADFYKSYIDFIKEPSEVVNKINECKAYSQAFSHFILANGIVKSKDYEEEKELRIGLTISNSTRVSEILKEKSCLIPEYVEFGKYTHLEVPFSLNAIKSIIVSSESVKEKIEKLNTGINIKVHQEQCTQEALTQATKNVIMCS